MHELLSNQYNINQQQSKQINKQIAFHPTAYKQLAMASLVKFPTENVVTLNVPCTHERSLANS